MLQLKWALFRFAEYLSELRARRRRAPVPDLFEAPRERRPALWLFVSTIGELNAVAPLIGPLLKALGNPPLLLMTDRAHYRDAYRAKYPDAGFAVLTGNSAELSRLFSAIPPLLLVIAEIDRKSVV